MPITHYPCRKNSPIDCIQHNSHLLTMKWIKLYEPTLLCSLHLKLHESASSYSEYELVTSSKEAMSFPVTSPYLMRSLLRNKIIAFYMVKKLYNCMISLCKQTKYPSYKSCRQRRKPLSRRRSPNDKESMQLCAPRPPRLQW